MGLFLQELLGVGPGEPTADGNLSWEWFACLGQCDHAPAMLVGEEAVRKVTPEALEQIVRMALAVGTPWTLRQDHTEGSHGI
jgi:NADH:ubiquinone oxidoreductase subunit E